MRVLMFCCCFLMLVPAAALAADPMLDQPNWSLEFKGGSFYPDVENWESFYGQPKTGHYAGSLAYKILRQIEVGIEVGYIRDHGQGYAPINQVLAGRVKYELAPINAFVLVRGIFSETQWLVPYAGGGYTKMLYRETVEGQGPSRGSVNGTHARAGLQLLLDDIDPGAANNMYLDYGVQHTFLFVEVERTSAILDSTSTDLGGISYLGGLLFEF